MACDAKSLLGDIKRFYFLQTERVEAYTLFEEGFVAYLNGAPNYNLEMYKALVNNITTAFSNISKEILSIEKSFHENNRTDISDAIRKIQEAEQQKLQTTAELQMKRQHQIDEPNSDMNEPIENLKKVLGEHIKLINEEMENLKYNAEDLYSDDG